MGRTQSGLRSTQRTVSKPASKTSMKDKLPPELERLADGIGSFIQYWGFKAIHGKIWTLLYLSKDPLSQIEMSRKLRVSKTLLSFSISELLEYDVIQEAGKGVKRTLYYQANPNLTAVILNVLRKRERPLLGEIASSFQRVEQLSKQIDSEFQLDLDRMKRMGEFVSSAQEALQSLILHTDSDSELMGQFLLIAAALARSGKV